MYPNHGPATNASAHPTAPGCDATKAVPVPMFLSRIDDNQSELGDAIRRLGDRLDVILCPRLPSPVAPGGAEAPRPTRSALADRLGDFSMRQCAMICVVNDIIDRLEV